MAQAGSRSLPFFFASIIELEGPVLAVGGCTFRLQHYTDTKTQTHTVEVCFLIHTVCIKVRFLNRFLLGLSSQLRITADS